MAYSPQGRAITGRRQYRPARTGRPPFYPKQQTVVTEEAIPTERQYEYGSPYKTRTSRPDLDRGYYRGMNKNDMMAAQEAGYYENIERKKRGEPPLTETEIHQGYIDEFKIPDDILSGLRRERSSNLPGGDMDISQGIPEGVSHPENFGPVNAMNEAGTQFGKGQIGKGAVSLGRGMLGMLAAPIEGVLAAAKPAVEGIKGLFGSNAPNLGSAVPSGTGISGLSGPMGLEGAIDLADLDIGGFGDGPGGGLGEGPPGVGGSGSTGVGAPGIGGAGLGGGPGVGVAW